MHHPNLSAYAVHNFSADCSGETSILAGSGATVINSRDGVDLEEFTAPATGSDVWWNVFEMDEDGNITPINALSDAPIRPSGQTCD